MVWQRHGAWHLNGGPAVLRLGESVPAGGLLTASVAGFSASIVVLLPDGQKMLCECFEAKTCAQGFRVPSIHPKPDPALWDTFRGVRNVLLMRQETVETAFAAPDKASVMVAKLETVSAIGPQGRVTIAPALRVLPAGQYALTIAPVEMQTGNTIRPVNQPLDWDPGQKAAEVAVSGPGVYRVLIKDQDQVPRIEIEVLATSPDSFANESEALGTIRQTLLAWARIHASWDLHDFLRVYLESRASGQSQTQ